MKKWIVAVLTMTALGAGIAMAGQRQGKMGRTGPPSIDEQVSRMKSSLNLSDHQATQVKELLQKRQEERKSWRANHPNPTREEMQTHRKEMMTSMNAGLRKILTPEQFKKHERMMKRGARRGPNGPPQS